MTAHFNSLNDLVIQPETEAERLILLHLSKRKARITPATGDDKAFLNLYLTFDAVLNPTNAERKDEGI